MSSLTYITTCKGRLAHLKQSLPRAVAQPGFSCVVVDYACPDGAAAWVAANYPQVRMVRREGHDHFNASHARNLGAQVADGGWLGFFDADVVLEPEFAAQVLPLLQRGFFYRAQPVTLQTWGSIICHREDFAAVGGYDEVYAGWGGEDDDLVAMLRTLGRREAGFPASLLREIPHGDELRTRFAPIKDRRLQYRINHLYLRIKVDMMTLVGRDAFSRMATAIFAECERKVLQAEAAGDRTPAVVIHLPPIAVFGPVQEGQQDRMRLGRTIAYTLDLIG